VDSDTAEIVAEARLEEPARAWIEWSARRLKRPAMRRHPFVPRIIDRVLSALGASPTALASLAGLGRDLALGHAERLFGKLVGPPLSSVLGLAAPKPRFAPSPSQTGAVIARQRIPEILYGLMRRRWLNRHETVRAHCGGPARVLRRPPGSQHSFFCRDRHGVSPTLLSPRGRERLGAL
jgi:hypothetical protein